MVVGYLMNYLLIWKIKFRKVDLKRVNVGEALKMTPDEKRISFYNRYFVFIKDKHVDANKVLSIMTGESKVEQAEEAAESDRIASFNKKKQKKNQTQENEKKNQYKKKRYIIVI